MEEKSNLRKIYEAIRGGIGSPMSGLGPTQEYMRDILKPKGFDERQAQADMSIREMFEIEFKRARERGDEVFDFMGKSYHTKTKEEVQGFSRGDSVYGPKNLVPGGGIPSMMINVPKINMPFSLPNEAVDIFDEDFEIKPLEIEYNPDNPYNTDRSAYENYMEATRTAEDDARDDLIGFEGSSELFEDVAEGVEEDKDRERKRKMKVMGEMLEMIGASSDFSPLVQGQIVKGSQASIPEIRRYAGGGIASMMPIEMREGGMTFNPFLDGMENRFGEFDPRDYIRNVLGIEDIGTNFGLTDEEIAETEAERAVATLARAYGAPSSGITSLSMGYGDTRPGASISIDAKDTTPDVYKFYPSEVSKIYAQAKGVPFSPLVAPPKEATYVEALQPRRIASQLYAKDGTFVERDQLVTGPGGERGDQIPAMLSDGEFVTNSAAVRGMGIAAGADPNDEYEQRLIGAREMYKMQKFGEEIAKMLR